jgi:hypothetical protein
VIFRSAARKVVRYAAIPLLAFVALAAWALSSPVGSSPDEDFHLSSIWCGQGTDDGACQSAASSDERQVPEALSHSAVCFAFHPETSAECQDPWFHQESDRLVTTDRGNFAGEYPPVFYYTMNFFVGDDVSRSVVLMRLVNAALFIGVMTGLYWLLPRTRRTMLTVGAVVALVPLGVFILPSVNPSSWAVIAGAAVFPAVVGFFETSGRRRLALAGVAGLATLMGAGARADAAVYVAIACVLATAVSVRWRGIDWKLLALPVVLCAACAASYLSSGQTKAASTGLDGSHEAAANVLSEVAHNLLNVPTLWAGSFGLWGLGWLDTEMPSVVWVFNLVIFGAVLFVGMRQSSRRKIAAVVLTLLAAWALPTLVLVQSSARVGSEVQPRYLLPLLVLLAQVALFRTRPERTEMSRAQLLCVAVTLSVTNAIALHVNLRRYVTGTDIFGPNLDAGREWWWAFAVSPVGVWLLGAFAFGVALVLCVRALPTHEADVVVGPSGDVEPVGAAAPRTA